MAAGNLSTGAQRGKALLAKNIKQWTAHCDKLEARDNLTEAEQDDLLFRRMQVKRWQAELKA